MNSDAFDARRLTEARALYPGLVSSRFYASWDFYTEILGFRTVCEWNHYVRLQHPGGAQLGILKEETDGQPAELISACDGRGLWLHLEVADADAEYERLRAAGVEPESGPADRPWGERSFTVRDPNGVLIFIAHRVAERAGAEPAMLAAPG